jgi:hypothetical protein
MNAFSEIEPKSLEINERRIRKIYLDVDKLALKHGWVSDWRFTTPREVRDLLEKWSDIPAEEQENLISKFFIERYAMNNFGKIDYFLLEWEKDPIFNKRMSIFRDCFFAIQHSTDSFNPSNLVVPVLITQIDGIIGELLEREGWKFDINSKKWIPPSPYDPKEKKEFKTGDRAIGNLLNKKRNRLGRTYVGNLIQTNSRYEIINEGLFQNSFHGNRLTKSSIPSRHKILHGEFIEYGTQKNTLKLILILDYLSKFNFINLVEPNDDNLATFRDPNNW